MLAVPVAAVMALAGCSGGSGGGGSATAGVTKSSAPKAAISLTPKNGATGIGIGAGAVKASVAEGKLTSVTLSDPGTGLSVPGTTDASKTSWKSSRALDRGTKYTLTAKAEDSDGKSATRVSRFTTVSKANSAIAYYTPENNSNVGVGMEVSFKLDKPVTDKKAVESAVTITSSTGQQAVGHWFGTQRLDFRPQEYWTAGSTVKVAFDLDGVEVSQGVYGVQNKSFTFTVDRKQVSTVDAATHQMTVVRDGATLKTIPVSTGSPKYPTWNGIMAIEEQFEQTKMDSTTVGLGDEYDIPDVPHAQRLTTSGTFIHGNYWSDPSIFGSENTSHGCIGLQDVQGGGDSSAPGAWFYSNSLLGDLVVVKNSAGGGDVAADNGLNGWNLSWATWTAGSALSQPGTRTGTQSGTT
ncbi:L,D-transpeptidase [Streptomyces beijiangensis]|uniref:L,D-transpeptidase family protein n=3 Tax=Streptomyces beijiangensis TaxID=163361 RepID=A0A939JFK8_9ACTN|nr:Ig-like domain-containing protein [Streptomyces beijiangensis]MBO0514246.1 L,D-transpeptidase family protein [Streptomyces beijiangensis]